MPQVTLKCGEKKLVSVDTDNAGYARTVAESIYGQLRGARDFELKIAGSYSGASCSLNGKEDAKSGIAGIITSMHLQDKEKPVTLIVFPGRGPCAPA